MGNNEDVTPVKAEKAQPNVQSLDQPAIHPYPEWATFQGYYGPRMMPPPYFGPTVAPGHVHPYMWGPQPLVPPFGSPYAAMYPPGGVYPHTAMPINHHGIVPSPVASEAVVVATPLSMEMQPKSPGNKDRGSTKKHKGPDGLPICNGSSDGNEQSQSGYNSAEGSEGSDGNNALGGTKNHRKGSTKDVVAPGNTIGPVLPSCPVQSRDLRVAGASKEKSISTHLTPAIVTHHGGPDLWMQDERELKREKRKQANRESARRSRLKKQAEAEELAAKVEALTAENVSIRAQIDELIASSEKLRTENSALMDKLKDYQSMQTEEDPNKVPTGDAPRVEDNVLSIMDEPNSGSSNEQQNDNNGKSSSRLYQLLDSRRRSNAVAAS